MTSWISAAICDRWGNLTNPYTTYSEEGQAYRELSMTAFWV